MKKITFIACLFCSIISYSQEIFLLDSETMQPIVGVAVYSDAESNVFSDFDGKVQLDLFQNDELITFKHLSYKTRSIQRNLIKKVVLLSMNSQSLDQIIISASRFAQNIKEIPQRILQISKQGIITGNPQTSADLLNMSGHIYIQKSQLGGGSPMIRGVSTNRLVLSVDGVRLNNAIYRGGNIHNVISIDPFSIENTEIIMGSSSVMYGSDAIGGAMNFYTKKPKFSETQAPLILINSTLRSASANNEKTGHFDINIGFKKLAFLTSFSRNDFEKFMKVVPERVLVILDEAYFEYACHIDEYPDSMHYRYDNVITFDKTSSVYLTGTNHAENQPVHLQLKDPSLSTSYTLEKFDEPAQRYCPAGVYEVQKENDLNKFVINSQNCIHCKTCDIKEPSQNINWITPEGGGGPKYGNM